ncbi:GGDEF domain-containing protein [Amphritea sp. HPY]|uniref:GGDEF domain-containing protein n=1 Tax=Amphritea sp. HPY TaxID=3421652 RepID=UPI003D7D3C65
MNLILKILLWMFPVALPVIAFTWNYYQVQLQASSEQIGHISSLVSGAGARELNDYLRLRASEFSIVRAGMDSCDDSVRGGNYELLVRDLMGQVRGFSALVVSDKSGRVQHSRVVSSYSDQHIQPDVLNNTLLLPVADFDDTKLAFKVWQDSIPDLRKEKGRLFLTALRLESDSEVNSEGYQQLQAEIFNLNQLLQTPPIHISYSGGAQAEALGLPYRRDTFLFTQPLLDCEQQINGYLTAFLDRTQIENRLLNMRKSLKDLGISLADVVLLKGEPRRFVSPNRYLNIAQLEQLDQLSENSSRYQEALAGFLSVDNVADEKILGRLLRQDEVSERGVSDEEYQQLIRSDSSLQLLVFVAEQEWKDIGQALLYQVSKWLLVSLLFLFVLIFFLARHIISPIVRLKRSVQRVAGGDLKAQAVVTSNDEVGQLAQAFNTMTEALARSERELKRLATTDVLTGLMNRRALTEEAVKERRRANRDGTKIAVVMLDLDHFKQVNDRYGHSSGDIVLQRFSTMLKQQLRITDSVSRIGGEEFVVLLPNTDLLSAHRLMEKILADVAEQSIELCDGATLKVSFSGGVIEWHSGDGFGHALTQADSQMYKAKERGRNCIVS